MALPFGGFAVEFSTVFPEGAFASGPAQPVRDFDRSSVDRFVQSADKTTGEPLWVVEVIDADPNARNRTVKVKITGSHQPAIPTPAPGMPFAAVEFTGMTATPYVDGSRCRKGTGKDQCGGRVTFSLKATGVRAPARGSRPAPAEGKDAEGRAA